MKIDYKMDTRKLEISGATKSGKQDFVGYDFVKIEKKWQKKWEEKSIFEADEKSKKKKFYVLDMFPYPSGTGLHMGHAFVFSLGDIFARFKRMQGYNVLYPIGYDALGLPAENAAINAGTHPKEYTKKSIANFMKQQKAMGWSYDWNRMINSSEPEFYRWDQWIFLKMLEKGIAYRKKAPVNWCPKCESVLANEQVIDGKCWRHEDTNVEIKHLEQWFFRITNYADELLNGLDKLDWPERAKKLQKNWIGKSYGTEIEFEIGNSEKKDNKFILVDAVHCLIDENGIVNKALKDYLDSFENKKIVLTNASFDKHKKLFQNVDYEIFSLENKPSKKDPSYYKIFLEKYKLKSEQVIYFEHDKENIESSESSGIKTFFYENNLNEIKSFIEDNLKEKWPIFTTRPDTIYGVTFMVVGAQHSRLMELVTKEQKKDVEKFLKKIKSVSRKSIRDVEELDKEGVFTGSYAINPLTKEKVPVYAGNFVVADYGSGMVMAVPAHDQRDFEFAKKYGIPMKKVIIPDRNYIVTITESLKQKFYEEVKKFAKIINNDGLSKIYTDEVYKVFSLAKNNFVGAPWYIHSEGKIQKILIHSNKEDKIFDWSKNKELKEAKLFGLKIGIKKEQLDFDELYESFTGEGKLINSEMFNGVDSQKAKEEITNYLIKNELGKKVVQFRLRDWLISRQRYWGTPIPVVYCDKCGIVPVPEKDLPIKLPEKVKFGKGNPLATAESWINVKCPKCSGKARRETDTMDTFANSSWYYLRYCDSKNDKKIFDEKKVDYWCPIDQYIGGPEHITMHLIYIRFYTKFLRDLGILKFDEPALKYFTQGIVHGSDGGRMSKSRGNVVEPFDMINKFGADTLRLALVSIASPDKDTIWDEKVVLGSHKFLSKVFGYFSNLKTGKSETEKNKNIFSVSKNPRTQGFSDEIVESKLNKTIKEVTEDVENFRHNIAVIKIRQLFDSFGDNSIDKKTAENFLKLLHVYCPYITEELWERLGNKNFISLSEWSNAGKIDEDLLKQDELIDKLVGDINNILKILTLKGEKKTKVKIFVIPNEMKTYEKGIKEIEKRVNLDVKILSIKDASSDGKIIKAKPNKPGIFLE